MTTDFRALCAELYGIFEKYDDESNFAGVYWDMEKEGNDVLDRARAALAEPEPEGPPLQPVPVSERLPAAEDCDADGRCWFHSVGRTWKDWYLLRASSASETETHWLPARALPQPS